MDNVKKEKSELHSGHRERMRKRFEEGGFDDFSKHEIMEFLLFFVYKRANTNEIGHRLIRKFGSLERILNADRHALMEVEGVGEQTALLICSMKEFFSAVLKEKTKGCSLKEFDDRCQYFLNLLMLESNETFLLACLDDNMHVLHTSVVARGTPGSVHFDKINVMKAVINAKCNTVMLAHNHPNGMPSPSYEDIETTRTLYQSLRVFNIGLADHIIVGDGRAISMMQSGSFVQ